MKLSTARKYIALGLAFTFVAAPGTAISLAEIRLSYLAYQRYKVTTVINSGDFTFNHHHIQIEPKVYSCQQFAPEPGTAPSIFNLRAPELTVDGVRATSNAVGPSRRNELSARQIGVVIIADRQTKRECVAIPERFRFQGQEYFRIIWIDSDAVVRAEWFPFGDRSHQLRRTVAIAFAMDRLPSFLSDGYAQAPYMLCPIIYPFGIQLIGLALIIVARSKRKTNKISGASKMEA